MDILTAITVGSKALEALKAIQDINKSYDAATWKARVAELMSDVADMKLALIDANDKIRALEREKAALTEQVAFKVEKTKYHNGLLYEVFDDDKVAEFPFCQHCMTGARYVRIVRSAGGDIAICPGCKTGYDIRSVMHQ